MDDRDVLRRRIAELEAENKNLTAMYTAQAGRLAILRKRRDALMELRDDMIGLLGIVKDDFARYRKNVRATLRPALERHSIAPSVLDELTAESAVGLAARLLRGTAETDPQIVVHRDIKPENMITDRTTTDRVTRVKKRLHEPAPG